MTKINRMVMHGFKSFAKHTELLFGPKFSVILGPNGSGKSNVLDSLCFVLGKSSAKSMRAEKSSNLIYNGGKTKKPAKHGEVSIYFDNTSKIFPTEDEEVKVTRIVRETGQSIYKINDNVRTREQVLDLLNIAKINPDGYNIILQGDIVRFVEMPPVERRMLIEDIAGIGVYEEKKHKALLELDKVEKKLNDADLVLKERNTYLKDLKKDRDQALKFKDMNEKITMYRASLLKFQIDKKEAEHKDLEEKLQKTKQDLDKASEKIRKLREESEIKKKEVISITKEIEEKGEVEQVNLNREVEILKIDLARKNYRLDTIKSEMVKITKRKEDLSNTIKETEGKIGSLLEDKEKLQKTVAEKEKEKETLNKKVQAFREKNKLDNLSDLDKEIDEIDKKSDELQKQIQTLREKQHNLIREKDSLQHQINTIDEQIKKVAEIEKEHQEEVDDLKHKRDQFKKTTLELNKRLNEDSSFAAQIGSSKDRLNRFNEQLAALETRNVSIREASLGDIAIKKVMSLKKPGIYGTVAELGNVNSKFALALEIASGPRIKSIVVEDDKIAADCIKYLKQNKLGIATFLPLSKISSKKTEAQIKNLSQSNGSHGMAIDLVEFEPKFKKAFEYIFANTIIVDNIDSARRLGVGKSKMVTLDGDLLELSGAMQGGFRDKRRKGMGFKEKELSKDIDNCKSEIAELENSIHGMEQKRADNEEMINGLRQTKAALEGEIIRTEKSLHLEPTDLEITKNKKEELRLQQIASDKSINDTVNQITEINKEFAGLKIRKQQIKSNITQLRDPALLAEISTFEEKLRQTNEEIIELRSELKNIDVRSDTLHKPERERIESILKQLAKDEAEFKEENNKLLKETKSSQELLKEKEEQAKVFYAKFKELFSKQSALNKEIQDNEVDVNKKREESVQIEIKHNTLSLKNSEIWAQLSAIRQEFQQYEGVKLDTEKNEDQLKYEIGKFEKMKQEIGFVNMRALEIYDEVEKEYNSLLEKKDSLANERIDVVKLMDEIEGKKKELFMEHYNVITEHFKRAFSALSSKGDAFLELENPENPFDGGLKIKVKITGTKFLDIRSLSGGEKTMTALAFIFAIQEHEPASFYILDEVDAALDKHNSAKLAKLVAKYSDKAQYIMISHNDSVISEAETLYGISMNEHGMSKVVSLKI
ncbi:MAG: chromosome segregation protein SMC [Nanoarchaeota archaeon]